MFFTNCKKLSFLVLECCTF